MDCRQDEVLAGGWRVGGPECVIITDAQERSRAGVLGSEGTFVPMKHGELLVQVFVEHLETDAFLGCEMGSVTCLSQARSWWGHFQPRGHTLPLTMVDSSSCKIMHLGRCGN